MFYIETIDRVSEDKLTHLKAVYFVRGTDHNIAKIQTELEDPKFAQYHLCKFMIYASFVGD